MQEILKIFKISTEHTCKRVKFEKILRVGVINVSLLNTTFITIKKTVHFLAGYVDI